MPDATTGKTEYIRQLCRSLRPILGDRISQVFEAYCAEDDMGKQQIETYLELLSAKHLPASLDGNDPGLIPPSEKQAYGPYTIGSVCYAGKSLYDFGLRENEWIQHVGVFGRSGAGKGSDAGEPGVIGSGGGCRAGRPPGAGISLAFAG